MQTRRRRVRSADAGQNKAIEELSAFKPALRKLSGRQVRDDLQILMNEYKDRLLTADTGLHKQLLEAEPDEALLRVFAEVQNTNEETKILGLLDRIIEQGFLRTPSSSGKAAAEGPPFVAYLKAQGRPLKKVPSVHLEILKAYLVHQLPADSAAPLKRNLAEILDLFAIEEFEEFLACFDQLF